MSTLINPHKGFIALISIIIIGFVLLFTVFTLGNRSIGGRFILLDLERKERSIDLASACVHVSIIALVNDPLWTPLSTPTTVPVGEEECEIVSVTHMGSLATVKTRGTISPSVTNVEAVWDSASEVVDSWREVATF